MRLRHLRRDDILHSAAAAAHEALRRYDIATAGRAAQPPWGGLSAGDRQLATEAIGSMLDAAPGADAAAEAGLDPRDLIVRAVVFGVAVAGALANPATDPLAPSLPGPPRGGLVRREDLTPAKGQ